MKEKNRLAIFDMDGTLVDTLEAHFLSFHQAFGEYGYKIDKAIYQNDCFGKHYAEFAPVITGGDMTHIGAIHALKRKLYPMYLDKTRLNNHLLNLIEIIKPTTHIALVTTASPSSVENILSYHQKKDVFEYIIDGGADIKPKPDPEGFFAAMTHFEIAPKQTMIFEDSEFGIQAALATGASVFRIKQF